MVASRPVLAGIAVLVLLVSGAAARTLSLVPATEVIDSRVVDQEGHHAGEIAYLLVDVRGAAVDTVLIENESAPDELIPVPWPLLVVGPGETVTARTSLETLLGVRRFAEETLPELTRPEVMAHLYGEFQQQRQDYGPAPRPHMLVGREYIATLVEPGMEASQQIIGNEVRTVDEVSLGRVQELLIDSETGDIAYAVVTGQKALGYGREWLAVPFQPLAWDMDERAYVLDIAAADIPEQARTQEALSAASGEVESGDLEAFYRAFDTSPYWE